MEAVEAAKTIATVALFVIAILLVYIVLPVRRLRKERARIRLQAELERQVAETREQLQAWKDSYHSEAKRHADTRDSLDALRDSHAQLQADYFAQGRELTLAQGLAKAAERLS